MIQLTINRTSWLTFRDTLANREPFRTYGNLSGEDHWSYSTGQLPADFSADFVARADYIDYVVYSYATPIAWHDTELGWIMPDVRYSTTTSKAQGRIAPAIAALNE